MAEHFVITVVGESGSGKNAACDIITELTGIDRIISTTDRAVRDYENGDEYHFLSKEEFDAIPEPERVAYGEFGGKRYCTRLSDFDEISIYQLEPDGFFLLKHDPRFDVFGVRITATHDTRLERTNDPERVARDDERYDIPRSEFDVVIDNNGSWDDLYEAMRIGLLPKLKARRPDVFE